MHFPRAVVITFGCVDTFPVFWIKVVWKYCCVVNVWGVLGARKFAVWDDISELSFVDHFQFIMYVPSSVVLDHSQCFAHKFCWIFVDATAAF